MKKTESHISFAKIEFKNAHKTPKISLDTREGWVVFGEDGEWYNNFPGYLIDLFNRSPKHSAIITGKLLYILGKGWTGTGTMAGFIDKPNADESLLQLSEKVVMDYEIFDGFYVEPIWNQLGNKVLEWRHVPYANMRSNYTGSEFWYSELWNNIITPKDKNVVEFRAYKPGITRYQQGVRNIYFYKAYRPGIKVYPLPNYMGGLAYIETDVEIANFNLNAIKNNLSVSKLVAFYGGIPTQEEREKFEKEFAAQKTGTDNAGQILFSWSDNRERGCEVLDLSGDDLDKRYQLLNETVQQEIFTAHKVVSPMLFGVKTAGQLGGRDEMDIANQLFKANYIEPRKMSLVKVFQMMAEAMGFNGMLTLNETEPVTEIPEATGQPSTAPTNGAPATQSVAVNDNIKNLTGRQHQAVLRIIRQFGKGQISKEIATTLLSTGYGLTATDINTLLGVVSGEPAPIMQKQKFADDHKKLIKLFSKYGMDRSSVEVLNEDHSWRERLGGIVNSTSIALLEQASLQEFASGDTISDEEAAVLDYLKKDKLTPATSIAKALNKSIDEITLIIQSLEESGYLGVRGVTKAGAKALKSNLPDTYDTFIVYHYDVAPGLGALIIPGTREFCRDLIGLNKVYSRSDIEKISQEYGYSVWDLRGGYYHNPKTDNTTEYCRHFWSQEIVTKKK